LINTQIATHLEAGAASCLTYADRLMEFPSALLGVALGVVLTPQLSAAHIQDDKKTFSELIEWGLRQLMLIAMPCAMALLVFSEPLVAVLYHRGVFAAHAETLHKTASAVTGYGVGLLGIVSIRILAPGYYARQDTATPVRIAVVVLGLTQLMNLLFVFGLHMSVAGLALSTGLGAMLNAAALLYGLWRLGSYRPAPGWGAYLARLLVASALMGLLLHFAAQRVDWVGLRAHELLRAAWMAGVLAVAGLVYFGALAASGLDLRGFLRRR
jgi:putative peptidoglycan lipid II flippase